MITDTLQIEVLPVLAIALNTEFKTTLVEVSDDMRAGITDTAQNRVDMFVACAACNVSQKHGIVSLKQLLEEIHQETYPEHYEDDDINLLVVKKYTY